MFNVYLINLYSNCLPVACHLKFAFAITITTHYKLPADVRIMMNVCLYVCLFQALSEKEGADKKRPADIRIMSSQYTSMQCWFFDTWTEYNECQSDYREKCKEKLTRQIQISEFYNYIVNF